MFKKKEIQPVSLKEKHYKYVLDEDFKPYEDFKNGIQYQVKTVSDHEIRFIDRGKGPLLLMLPGSTGKALSFYEYIQAFSNDFRVVAIDYPVVSSLKALTETLYEFILKLNGENEIKYVMANSFGTVALQELLIKDPSLFDQIFFIHGISKDEMVSKKTVKMNQRSIKSFLKSVSFLNFESFKKRFGKRIRNSISIYSDNVSMRLFWEGFFEEMLYSTSQEEMISNYTFMKDFWEHIKYEKDMFAAVTQPVFIIEAFTDMDAELSEKLALCALFENHELFILKGDANLSIIKNKTEIVTFIMNKMLQKNSEIKEISE